jgi:hypothetical protein
MLASARKTKQRTYMIEKKDQIGRALLRKKSHIWFPGIPGSFPRETGNAKRTGFRGKREREIPGSNA